MLFSKLQHKKNDGFKFCPYCGTHVISNKWSHCGAANLPEDAMFCPDCGHCIEQYKSNKTEPEDFSDMLDKFDF